MLPKSRSSKRGSNVPKRYRDFEIATPPPQKVQIMSKKSKEKEATLEISAAQTQKLQTASKKSKETISEIPTQPQTQKLQLVNKKPKERESVSEYSTAQKVQVMPKKPRDKDSIINSQPQRRPVTPSAALAAKSKEKSMQVNRLKKANTPPPAASNTAQKRPEQLTAKLSAAKVDVALSPVSNVNMKSQAAQTK